MLNQENIGPLAHPGVASFFMIFALRMCVGRLAQALEFESWDEAILLEASDDSTPSPESLRIPSQILVTISSASTSSEPCLFASYSPTSPTLSQRFRDGSGD
jgi:hypothetical protein